VLSQKIYKGDTVRITKAKQHFAKGYKENWTLEIFKIKQIQYKENKLVVLLTIVPPCIKVVISL